jgi:hypothetical protein
VNLEDKLGSSHETQPGTLMGTGYSVTHYRLSPICMAVRFALGACVAAAGAFCVNCCFAGNFVTGNFGVVAAHAAVVLIGLCMILDALVARLSLDEDAIEIRRLNGTVVLWRKHEDEARAKSEPEIQRWRNTLSLNASEIARTDWVAPRQSSVWLLVPIVVAAEAAFNPPFHLPNEALEFRLALETAAVFCAALSISVVRARLAGAGALSGLNTICASAVVLLYLFGAASLVNAAYDRSLPIMHRVTVAGTHYETRYFKLTRNLPHRVFYLRLAPWSEQPGGSDLEVPAAVYNSFRAGDSVCIELHPGRLGFPWYTDAPKCSS